MQLPLQITFRHMEPSAALEARIRELAAKLDLFHDRIMRCRVVVEAPHQHHRQGQIYSVRVDVTVPGGELYADNARDLHHAHEDPYLAAHDAFDAIGRRLEDYAREHRGKVKHHELLPHGTITELNGGEGFGRIETVDGRSLYFHRNSVKGFEFDRLEKGMPVEFEEEPGEEGPQCVAVRLAERPVAAKHA
jgi:cold shock CspA family protein